MTTKIAASLIAAVAVLALAAPALAETGRMVATEPGVQIHIVEAGPANALPPLVLVPGWSTSAEVWRDRKSTRLNSSHPSKSRMPSSA